MTSAEQDLLVRAFRLAARVHQGHTRKGKPTPYLSHPLQVAGLVLEHGGDVEMTAAALLHDTLEDGPDLDVQALRSEFGSGVADRVAALTDLLDGDTPERKGPWLDRKRRYLGQLERGDSGTRLIAGCDKLDNLRELMADLRSEGLASLERFTATPAQTRWYYEEVRRVTGPDLPDALSRELDDLLVALARFVPLAAAEPGDA
jgi:(p)ppGpp synthase/HD superfamily hydrolase